MPLELSRAQRLYFIGLGGIGMSALARYLKALGHHIAGSDQSDSSLLAELRAEGIGVAVGHVAEHLLVAQPDLVVITAAIRPDNVELLAARAANLPVATLAEVVGELTGRSRTLAVAGTHGKTTTTSLLAFLLKRAGHDPSYLIGGLAPDLGGNAHFGAGDLFVVEADEYAGRFLTLQPTAAVVTNLDHDHPDVYPDLASLDQAFAAFLGRVRPDGLIVLRADDAGCQRLAARLPASGERRLETFGLAPARADWLATPLDVHEGDQPTRFQLSAHGQAVGEFRLALPGSYNIANACAAIALAASVGVEPATAASLVDFRGVGRRFELKGLVDGVTVIDDYAHHPTELSAILSAARRRYPRARLWCLFQPHTFSRTRLLFDDFVAVLRQVDRPVICPVYAAREPLDSSLSAERLAEAVGPGAQPVASVAAAAELAAGAVEPGDVVITAGAGDITAAGPHLLALLRTRQQRG